MFSDSARRAVSNTRFTASDTRSSNSAQNYARVSDAFAVSAALSEIFTTNLLTLIKAAMSSSFNISVLES